jgi:uronate dehydrogenase
MTEHGIAQPASPLAEQIWVVTGAAGRVGRCLVDGLRGQVHALRVADLELPATAGGPVDAVEPLAFDVRDLAACEAALRGADGVVHLAGIPDEADFDDLVDTNIVGTHRVLEAARRSGVRRVVLASTNRTTGFYPAATEVDPTMPARPDSFYAVSKVAVEALGRLYADKFGLEVVNVRIGSFEEQPRNVRHLSTWLSPADCVAAFVAAMTAPGVRYATFYGVSNNTRRFWSLDAGAALGFHPGDDAEGWASTLSAEHGPLERQSGEFTEAAYTLDRQRPLT